MMILQHDGTVYEASNGTTAPYNATSVDIGIYLHIGIYGPVGTGTGTSLCVQLLFGAKYWHHVL